LDSNSIINNETEINMKKRYIYAFAGLFLLGLGGCKKLDTFGDTNVDPSRPTTPIPSALFTNACASIPGLASTGVLTPGFYGQYFSETQYNDVSLYSLQQLGFTGSYTGELYDLQTIINLNSNNNLTQASIILQQYIFWTMTDRWGDIPYSQALNALLNPKPKYDRQEEIYKGMISKITAAVAAFDNTPIAGDILNNGNVDLWKRLGNSLRMMMALQLSKRYPAAGGYSATEFNAALTNAAGYIASNDQNFKAVYPGGNFQSPWFSTYNGRKDLAESKTMTDLMASLLDTRQNAYGGASEQPNGNNALATSNIGVPYGVDRTAALTFTDANPTWARVLRGDLRTPTGTVVIISAAEVALARAEAAERGWTSESPAAVYSTGIDLSFAQWGITMPANYKAQSGVVLGARGSAENIGKIAIQEYIASYPDGLRAWNLYRRTGFPALSPAPAATNSPKAIPRRFAYSTAEYTGNPEGIASAIAALPGGDLQSSKIWWDQ
jgi:hypothetical protein